VKDLENILQETQDYYTTQEKNIISRLALLPKGSIKGKEINRDIYYYLRFRKGKKVIDKYIGKRVSSKLYEELEERKKLEKELKQVRKGLLLLNKKLNPISDLTEPVQKIFKEFTKQGLWESGIEVIGSWCFLIYQKYLPLEKYPLRTQDIDILIPLPYKGKAFNISYLLKQLGFEENFNPDGSTFFTGSGLKIEFLSQKRGREKRTSEYIKSLTISPQLLRFMDILLRESITINIAKGIRVRLPSPCSFFLHKLLIAVRWQRVDKKEKDIKQAITVSRYIVSDEEELKKLMLLWNNFPKAWKSKVHNSIALAYDLLPLEKNMIKKCEETLK